MTLKELRIQKGLTQKQLGDKLNLSSQAVGNYENGKRDMNIKLIPKYAEILNVTCETILFAALKQS